MRKRPTTHFQTPYLTVFVLALCAALALVGCDSNNTADREDFDIFERRTWRVGSFRIDNTDLTERLNDQYDSRVTFTFSTEDDEDDRRFEIFARRTGENDLLVGGEIDIDGDDDEMNFYPETGNAANFEVDYQILGGGDRVVLTTNDNDVDGRILRTILLPNSTVGDEFPEARLVLTR